MQTDGFSTILINKTTDTHTGVRKAPTNHSETVPLRPYKTTLQDLGSHFRDC